MSYYKNELSLLSGDISVQFFSEEKNTKTLNVNLQSIKDIRNFLNRLERQLIKDQIKENDNKLRGA